MNGTEKYELNIENCINNRLEEYPRLVGFANYLTGIVALSTKYNYINHVIRFLDYINKEDKDLEFDDYTLFLNSLRNTTMGYQRCASFALKRYSEYLVYSGKSSEDIMKKIKAPKNIESIKTREKREKAFLTKREVDITFNNIKTGIGNHNALTKQEHWRERDKAIMMLFLSTGIRCSALFKLDINNINWKDSTIIVIDKGSKIHKYILPPKTMEALREWIDKRNNILDDEFQDALFISNRKERLCQTSIAQIVKKYTSNIEGKHITPHKLRATFGTHLYNETRDIKFVQDQMGHSNPKTTELYIRGNQDADRKKAADIMSDFLN